MKLDYPATRRNQDAIFEVLSKIVNAESAILEIASGSGQHAAFLAPKLGVKTWQPTDIGAQEIASIDAWQVASEAHNVAAAKPLDVLAKPWAIAGPFDSIYAANLIHISPWPVTEALFAGGRECLSDAGQVILYGPFIEHDQATVESNLRFDASLRERNSEWGIRHLEDVAVTAAGHDFALMQRHAMPANNLLVVFARREDSA